MAVTRRVYIFGAFLSSVLSVLLILVAISSDGWVTSTATAVVQFRNSTITYGLFGGELLLYNLITPTSNSLHMTCVSEYNACALSCKTEEEARIIEVEAMAQGFAPSPACSSVTEVDRNVRLDPPPVISFAFYVSLLVILFMQLIFAVITAGLAILNATRNPTEPIFGLPGCLWTNVAAAALGLIVLLMFGIYFLTSGLKEHLALSYIALDLFVPHPGAGYSYWILVPAIFCNLINICLLRLRTYLLERDPPPPTIKVDANADGNMFIY